MHPFLCPPSLATGPQDGLLLLRTLPAERPPRHTGAPPAQPDSPFTPPVAPDPFPSAWPPCRRVTAALSLSPREELLSSPFWACSQRAIQESLSKCLEQGEKTPGSMSEVLCSFENLQLEPSHQSVMKPSSPSGEPAHKSGHLRCVCYGIGSFSSCVISRYQLAFLLLLLEKLQIPKSQCYIFDPLFSELEISVLNDLGVTVVLENEEGKHHIHEFTIFYMIHCGKALYNNLLWSNWSVDALSKMIIIGNSFKGIEERLLARILERDYLYIAKILKGTEEAAFPIHPQYMDIFNDTSIHWFPLQKLKELPPEAWQFQEEPMYPECDDLEIIRK
ncbi:SRR1-like protein isoform X1 [Chrysemys picta bellii]|uniref:SRR1-like protein isoform X1 n=1 Tax=Chrysemys picta bellii TaxID=8478 RepID=UPI0032B15727